MASSTSLPKLRELAATIELAVAKIQEALDAQGAPSPSFDEDAPPLPSDIGEARDIVLDATAELQDLLTEPLNMIHRASRSDKSACIQVISRFGIASLVPPGGRISFRELADQTPLTEQMVGRIVRHAATMRIFYEPEPGMVAHTKASRMLASQDMQDWARAGTEELGSAAGKLANALERWPGSQEPNETGFSLANDTTDSIYQVIAKSPERAVRFANAMKVMTGRPEFDLSYALDHYDWASLGKAQVVDVGGAKGHFSLALARQYSNLQIVVQDMSHVVQSADAGDLGERVRFMAHDLFDQQTVSADVFFFRWIFHNWPDKYCIRILRAQIPALKAGARLIVQEAVMPEPGTVAQWKEKDFRSMDLEMAFTFNARERTLADWEALFKEADPAFVLQRVVEPKGSAMSILEFSWEGDKGGSG
ncbi:S-adenosyl-L-methionine-dependent methyltransferase [Chaetomium sp. MPI-CAGE-AT-0009]|nr:S-adenosyl-L-methionine-dependent methyltransferase [Chaetomium sp. MPI-CAGE-AT-0009]